GAIRQAPSPGYSPIPPEFASPTFGLKRVTLGRGTGGYDNDNLPGDEALQVVVEPRDGDDHIVKVPASLHVAAIEINTQGLNRPASAAVGASCRSRTGGAAGAIAAPVTR